MQISTTWPRLCVWLLGLFPATGHLAAQQFTWTFVDAERDNREIPVDFRHPVPMMEGTNLVVVGHGFAMQATDYDDLADALVADGYVVALLATESGLAPDHEDFGLDLAHVAGQTWQTITTGPIAGNIAPVSAIVGHSMGGGAAWIGAATAVPEVAALVGLAPAETNPSAIAAAAAVGVPVLVISGSADAVTPPDEHHLPIYNGSVLSPCRALVTLNDGGHCGFADEGTVCEFGELFFNGMDRPTQQAHAFALMASWFAMHLDGNDNAWSQLEDHVANAADVTMVSDCETVTMASMPGPAPRQRHLHPNPATHHVVLPSGTNRVLAFDGCGRPVQVHITDGLLNVSNWPPGLYTIAIEDEQCWLQNTRLVVN